MRTEKRILLSATAACLVLAGMPPAASRADRGVALPDRGIDLSSPAGEECLLRLVESDLGGGPSSFSSPASDGFLSWATGGGAVLSVAPSGLDDPPTVLQGNACHDFVTGGGTIAVGSGIGSFGFVAGLGGGGTTPFVALDYVDHNIGLHFQAISITAYNQGVSPECRHFEGAALINGIAGVTYTVDVCDVEGPGPKEDTFSMTLSFGYAASGVLEDGNIQLHDNCP
ncbi:MAG TPA: post-COAP-1 domain-containing protein [Planctomycetota bacterium]|nr:post-COAP-1 domain-containing protein [Planctomycetota bacterium]